MIIPVSKIQIIGPQSVLMDLIKFLKNKKIVHPEREITYFCGDLRTCLKNYNSEEESVKEKILYESLKRKIEEFFVLTKDIDIQNMENDKPDKNLLSIAEIEEDLIFVKNWMKKLEDIKRRKEEIEFYLKFLYLTKENFGEHIDFSNLEIIGLLLKNKESVERLKKLLEEKGGDLYKIITKTDEKNNFICLIVYPKEIKEFLKKSLKELNFPEIVTPSEQSDSSLTEKIKSMEGKIALLEVQMNTIRENLNKRVSEKRNIYLHQLNFLKEKLREMEDRVYIYKSEKLFFLFGWIPKQKVDELKRELSEKFKDIVLEELEILEEEKEKVPVILQNRKYFEAYQIFTNIFPLPCYSSYDPTIFLGIFFPIFFGLIVGDIGYGLIIIILTILGQIFLKKAFLKEFLKVLFYGGLSSIIFGFLFGEFFGRLGENINFIKAFKFFDREHSIIHMFLISICVGIAHVLLGFLLNFIRPAHKKERLVSLILIFCIFLLVVISYLIYKGVSFAVVSFLIFISILFMFFAIVLYGIIFPLELIKAIGNIVSYGRIMAIGLSSVILANVANNFFGATGNVFVGILIAIFIHLINILLSVFSPTIHSLRLHYVEFFSKFMKFGGRKFSPL